MYLPLTLTLTPPRRSIKRAAGLGELLDRAGIRVDAALHNKYFRLLCQFNRGAVYTYLTTHHDYSLDSALDMCRRRGATVVGLLLAVGIYSFIYLFLSSLGGVGSWRTAGDEDFKKLVSNARREMASVLNKFGAFLEEMQSLFGPSTPPRFDILDATAYLLERMGDATTAMNLLLKAGPAGVPLAVHSRLCHVLFVLLSLRSVVGRSS